MRKAAGWKKAMASLVSAATLFSCTITGTMNFSTVTAADGANYAEALAMSLYFFDANEYGTEVDDNCLTWRGNCHTYDAEASLDSAANLSSSEKAMIKEANGGSNTVDVSGGYHDAGDHIKFNVTMGFAASSLAMSYYMNPGAYEKANCEGHFREVLKKEGANAPSFHVLTQPANTADNLVEFKDLRGHVIDAHSSLLAGAAT